MTKIQRKRRAQKVVVSGQVIERYKYTIPIDVDEREHEVKRKEDITEREKRDDNLFRARQKIRRYIWANQTEYTKFVTLTFMNTCLDLNKVLNDWKNFARQLKRHGFDLKGKYIWILEHQKERGLKEGNEGSYHIHAVLFYDEFIPFEVLNKCWKHGSTDIHKTKAINNLGAYICKYLTKEEFILVEKNSYHIGRGLNKPLELCQDGYTTELNDLFDLINEHADYYYSNISEYAFEMPDGSIFQNSVQYQQGKVKL